MQGLVWKPLPSLVFGIGATCAGLLYVFLPETLGQLLPDTIEQAEKQGRRPSIKLAYVTTTEFTVAVYFSIAGFSK